MIVLYLREHIIIPTVLNHEELYNKLYNDAINTIEKLSMNTELTKLLNLNILYKADQYIEKVQIHLLGTVRRLIDNSCKKGKYKWSIKHGKALYKAPDYTIIEVTVNTNNTEKLNNIANNMIQDIENSLANLYGSNISNYYHISNCDVRGNNKKYSILTIRGKSIIKFSLSFTAFIYAFIAESYKRDAASYINKLFNHINEKILKPDDFEVIDYLEYVKGGNYKSARFKFKKVKHGDSNKAEFLLTPFAISIKNEPFELELHQCNSTFDVTSKSNKRSLVTLGDMFSLAKKQLESS